MFTPFKILFYSHDIPKITPIPFRFIYINGWNWHMKSYGTCIWESIWVIRRKTWRIRCMAKNISQTATRESRTSDWCDAFWYGHRCQAAAFTESIRADRCDAFRYGHRCQAAAATESIISNWCDAFRYGHRCQAATTIVFASHFISTTCMLNGRKVIT